MTEKEEEEIRKLTFYVNRMQEVFNEIKDEFGGRARLAFSFSLLDNARSLVLHDVNSYCMDCCSKDLERFCIFYSNQSRGKEVLETEIASANKLLVTCVNDKKQPKKLLLKVKAGYIYQVKEILINNKGKTCYKLLNINEGEKDPPLNASRFKSIVSSSLT